MKFQQLGHRRAVLTTTADSAKFWRIGQNWLCQLAQPFHALVARISCNTFLESFEIASALCGCYFHFQKTDAITSRIQNALKIPNSIQRRISFNGGYYLLIEGNLPHNSSCHVRWNQKVLPFKILSLTFRFVDRSAQVICSFRR